MALNIKDPETERLARQVAELAGETKTGAVRVALQQRLERLRLRVSPEGRAGRRRRFLEEEVWPLVPPEVRGVPISKEEREQILGYGPSGV